MSGTSQLVGERSDGDRVVGAVRAGDADASLVDEIAEPVGRVLRRSLRQAVLGMQHELDRTVEQALFGGLVEREAVDPVVAAAGAVERGAQPADLDRFHSRAVPSSRRRCDRRRDPYRAYAAGSVQDDAGLHAKPPGGAVELSGSGDSGRRARHGRSASRTHGPGPRGSRDRGESRAVGAPTAAGPRQRRECR